MNASVISMGEFLARRGSAPVDSSRRICDGVKDALSGCDVTTIDSAVRSARTWFARHDCTVAKAIEVGVRSVSSSPRDPFPPNSPLAA